MRGTEFLDKMEFIDSAYIEAADKTPIKKKNVFIKWGTAVACLSLIIGGLLLLKQPENSINNGNEILFTENGVVIPQLDISLSADSVASADMLAFFIYQGRCYVHYEWIDNIDIVGEYLGTSIGLIDEWTPKDGYVDFAGSVKGDFFEVKGFDPTFMLCLQYSDGMISTYVCNTGITLKYGWELYQDRLHLTDNYISVQFETRQSWYYSKGETYQLTDCDAVIKDFISALNTAEFIPWKTVPPKEGKTTSSIYDTEIYHVYFLMNNGTTVHLRLYEKGYVRFQGLLDVCVQISNEAMESFTNLLDSIVG